MALMHSCCNEPEAIQLRSDVSMTEGSESEDADAKEAALHTGGSSSEESESAGDVESCQVIPHLS